MLSAYSLSRAEPGNLGWSADMKMLSERYGINSFLDASKHLYKRVCPSVHPSVRLSVHPSVCPSVSILKKPTKMAI